MKISARARYGVRMMIQLATSYNKGPMYLKDISKNEAISEKYLSQIILPLKANGLVTTPRGVHGGYSLNRDPELITAKDVIETLEGDLSPLECIKNPTVCERAGKCAAQDMWRALSLKMKETLSAFTLKDLALLHKKKIER